MQECARHLNKLFLWVKGEMSWIEKAVIKVNVIVGQNPSGGWVKKPIV